MMSDRGDRKRRNNPPPFDVHVGGVEFSSGHQDNAAEGELNDIEEALLNDSPDRMEGQLSSETERTPEHPREEGDSVQEHPRERNERRRRAA